jgi:hypothetical protein
MNPDDRLLVKRLGLALAIKLVVLLALWWGFVRDQRRTVDAQGMATQALVKSNVAIKGDKR